MTDCDRWMTPPVTVAPPLELRASTLPLLQLPTPTRGVESVPWIVEPLFSFRLPLVPTFPPLPAKAGVPLTQVDES